MNMSGSEQAPSIPVVTVTGTSPEPPQPTTPPQTPTTSIAVDATTTTASCSTQRPQSPVESNSSLEEFQEHLSLLRDGLVATEDSLDTVPHEEFPQLKTALLQVSSMISQMESVADVLSEKRFNLKNELRTLQDENVHLQGALVLERRKAQAKNQGGTVSRGAKTSTQAPPLPLPPPPPPPRRDSSAMFGSTRPFLLTPVLTRYQPLSDNDSSVVDLTSDSVATGTSSSRGVSTTGTGTGITGYPRKGRGTTRGRRCGTNMTTTMIGLRRPGGARRSRGTGGRCRLRPCARMSAVNDSNSSSRSVVDASSGASVSAVPETQVKTPPVPSAPPEPTPSTDPNGQTSQEPTEEQA